MSRTVLDPDTIVPAWLKAMVYIDDERPTTTELRQAIRAVDYRTVPKLISLGVVDRFDGLDKQGKPVDRLRLTDDGRGHLRTCLQSLHAFVIGDSDPEDDALEMEAAQ